MYECNELQNQTNFDETFKYLFIVVTKREKSLLPPGEDDRPCNEL